MVTDPISDFITRIKNASDAGKASVSIPYSALKESIAHALVKGGYISSVAHPAYARPSSRPQSAASEAVSGLETYAWSSVAMKN